MAAAKVKIEDKDYGWQNIQKHLKSLEKSYVLIGFQEGEVTKKQEKDGRTKEAGKSMAQIAADNEFGTSLIPSRSFMRTSFDENKEKIEALVKRQYNQIVLGKKSAKNALQTVGLGVVGMIQRKIRQITSPPNSPYTIAIKGSSKPLIDFGQMIQSVREKVVMNEQ